MSKLNLDMLSLALRKTKGKTSSGGGKRSAKDVALEKAMEEFKSADTPEAQAKAFKAAIRIANEPE